MSSVKLKFYYNKESNELIIADKDMVVVDNLLTDKIAVQTPTQEDWDFVIGKVREKYYNNLDSYGKVTCIELSNGCHDDGEWYECNNYHIITIDQFRALFKDKAPKDRKVYIRGHATRGSDVLSKLESLGGVNPWKWECDKEDIFYSIGPDSIINGDKVIPDGYTEILLEEPIFYSRYLNNLCSTDSDGNFVPNVLFSPRAKVIFPSPMMAEANKKVVIRGHATRGAEVLAKLEGLGGINKWYRNCESSDLYYFIDEFGLINYKLTPPQDYTEIFLDEPVTEEPKLTKEQVELKVVEYAKSVNWDYENIIELLLCRIISEEFMILDGDNPSDKAKKIFNKYKPKSESEPDITELKSDKTDSSGYKQSENKLSYELDWNFITQIAERMEANKGKYDPYNWQKPIDTQDLRNAITRHAIEVAKGNFADDGRPFGHLEALACNSMMLNFQLQNKK